MAHWDTFYPIVWRKVSYLLIILGLDSVLGNDGNFTRKSWWIVLIIWSEANIIIIILVCGYSEFSSIDIFAMEGCVSLWISDLWIFKENKGGNQWSYSLASHGIQRSAPMRRALGYLKICSGARRIAELIFTAEKHIFTHFFFQASFCVGLDVKSYSLSQEYKIREDHNN